MKFTRKSSPRNEFETVYSDIYRRRNNYSEILTDVDWSVFPKYRLELKKIIGRRAKDRRRNLWVSANNQLVYSAGTMIVLLNLGRPNTFRSLKPRKTVAVQDHSEPNSESIPDSRSATQSRLSGKRLSKLSSLEKVEMTQQTPPREPSQSASYESESSDQEEFKQDFFTAEQDNNIKAPGEISCIEMAKDQRLLCVGISDAIASLCFWDIPSRSFLGKVQIPKCVTVLNLRFSDDWRNLVCLGLTKSYSAGVYFVSVQERLIVAHLTLSHSLPYKIRDCSFVVSKNSEFVTVGIHHASRWQCTGNVLSFRELKYEEPYDSMKAYRKDDADDDFKDSHLPGFLCIVYLRPNVFLTSCSKGFVYGWLNDELAVKRWCFLESPVTVMEKCPHSESDVVVGGFGKPPGVLSGPSVN